MCSSRALSKRSMLKSFHLSRLIAAIRCRTTADTRLWSILPLPDLCIFDLHFPLHDRTDDGHLVETKIRPMFDGARLGTLFMRIHRALPLAGLKYVGTARRRCFSISNFVSPWALLVSIFQRPKSFPFPAKCWSLEMKSQGGRCRPFEGHFPVFSPRDSPFQLVQVPCAPCAVYIRKLQTD